MEYVRLVLLTVLVCISGSATNKIPETVELVVGQPFHYAFETSWKVLDVQDASGEALPAWLIWKSNERILEGIPQRADIGKTFVRITNDLRDNVMEISVKEEINNPCDPERSTMWMEIAFNTSMSSLTTADQLQLINTVSKFFNVNSSSLRIYSNKYKEDIQRAEVVESGMQHEPNDDSVTIMWKLSCDELDEDAIDVLEKMLTFDESDTIAKSMHELIGWRLKKGTLLPRKERIHIAGTNVVSQLSGFATNEPYVHFETTTSSKTTTRSTRSTKKTDKPPVRLNSLQTFTCNRGTLCEYTIPRETFMDVEDGDTRSLSLSVLPIVAEKNWLSLDKTKQNLRGISLQTGDFEFRLEARDSSNQMTSAPFRVTVVEAPPTNHLFILDVAHSSERLTKDPDTLYAFAEKLANSLGDRYPKNLVIRKIEAIDGNRPHSRIAFSNATLSNKFCHKKAIDAIKHMMLTRKRDRIRADFVRSMDSRFHVRSAKLHLQGPCAEELPHRPVDAASSTTPDPPEYDESSGYLWLPVALIAFLIFFLATLILICCLVRRRKTKAVQSEFISKGLPVVFPEEIPQEDESATVSTPMLVREERPPLIISQHENPLYKPPPPLSAASSPRPRNAFTNQRPPPPYVPP